MTASVQLIEAGPVVGTLAVAYTNQVRKSLQNQRPRFSIRLRGQLLADDKRNRVLQSHIDNYEDAQIGKDRNLQRNKWPAWVYRMCCLCSSPNIDLLFESDRWVAFQFRCLDVKLDHLFRL